MFHANPLKFVLGNMTMVQEYMKIPFAVGAYWTLGLELVFYVLCSALFAVGYLRRAKLCLALSLVGLLAGQMAFAWLGHSSLPAGRIGLLVTAFYGSLLFRMRDGAPISLKVLLPVPALLSVFLVTFWIRFGIYPVSAPAGAAPRPTTVCAIVSWTVAYICFLTIYALRSKRFPAPLTWLGRISYSVYLLHGIVICVVPNGLPAPVYCALTLTITLGLAHCTYHVLEEPIGRLQHRVLRPTVR
jgi:peptidoglycan/LPS O-acetylase OafA/YrhL